MGGSTSASSRKVPFLPVMLRLDQLLLEFQRNRVHLAMLLDEYGSVVGMATLENVLEELVGPIQDEFDRETPQITPLGEDVYEVDASCPLDVLAETCKLEVPETDAETAGGLVLDLLGRLARPGDSVSVDGHRLTVLRADPTRIRKIRIEPVAPRSPPRRPRATGRETEATIVPSEPGGLAGRSIDHAESAVAKHHRYADRGRRERSETGIKTRLGFSPTG